MPNILQRLLLPLRCWSPDPLREIPLSLSLGVGRVGNSWCVPPSSPTPPPAAAQLPRLHHITSLWPVLFVCSSWKLISDGDFGCKWKMWGRIYNSPTLVADDSGGGVKEAEVVSLKIKCYLYSITLMLLEMSLTWLPVVSSSYSATLKLLFGKPVLNEDSSSSTSGSVAHERRRFSFLLQME